MLGHDCELAMGSNTTEFLLPGCSAPDYTAQTRRGFAKWMSYCDLDYGPYTLLPKGTSTTYRDCIAPT